MILGVLLSVLFLSVVEINSQTVSSPYLSFQDQNLTNNSYVDLSLVNGTNTVQCRSELRNCCSSSQGPDLRGHWFFPNGTVLPFPGYSDGIFQSQGAQRVDLRRISMATSPTGIYRCNISYNTSAPRQRETFYVGLYISGGSLTISGDVTLTVNSDLNEDSPQFTLTCISTGGPATTITWTRDSATVTEGTDTVLDDPVTAQYTHTLTVTGRLPGLYSCTVGNSKPSTDSESFAVQVASAPTNLMFKIGIDSTSVLLTWTPPTPLGYTTGYRISFTGGGSGNKTVSGGSTDNYTLAGLRRGEMYNISIVGLSEHFSSESVAWNPLILPVLGAGCVDAWRKCSDSYYVVSKDDIEAGSKGKDEGGKEGEGGGGDGGEKTSGGRGDSGPLVAGVLSPLLLIAIIVIVIEAVIIARMRTQSNGQDHSHSPPIPPPDKRHTYEEVDEVGEIKEVGGAGDTKNLEGIVFFSNAAYAHIALNSIQAS